MAGVILPWNAPITLLVRSLALALAAGCSVVLKPAHQTALVHDLALECLVADPRLPRGVVNSVIESGAEASRFLCESPDVDVISFTGSSKVGKLIAQASAGTLKRLSLELGGKAPALVFDDCDVGKTVSGIINFGTVWCNSHNRLFAEAETGGYRDSGYGKLHGTEGMNAFLQTKHFYFET